MGDVVEGRFITTKDIPPDRVIDGASEWGMAQVVIVGLTEDGDFKFSSSQADSAEVLYLLERAKHELFSMEDHIRENGDPRGKGA